VVDETFPSPQNLGFFFFSTFFGFDAPMPPFGPLLNMVPATFFHAPDPLGSYPLVQGAGGAEDELFFLLPISVSFLRIMLDG
jgi:hypothetical protein